MPGSFGLSGIFCAWGFVLPFCSVELLFWYSRAWGDACAASVMPKLSVKNSLLLLAASEKNFLGRVLEHTPFENFYLPCKQQKILFFRILPAPSLLSMPVGLALLANRHGASRHHPVAAPVFRFAPDGMKEFLSTAGENMSLWPRKKFFGHF